MQSKCYQMFITRKLQLANLSDVPNDGDTPEVYLNARDKFRIATFYTIVDKLATDMKSRRRDIQRNSREIFISSVQQKNIKTRFSHAELYKIILEDNISYIFNINGHKLLS